ncbi:MAG: type IV secretory system conjugative DNA transfer family protein [Janthinobacterium lividum]
MNIFTLSTIWRLVKLRPSLLTIIKTTVIVVGAILTPVTLLGAFVGFRRAQRRFTDEEHGAVTFFNGRISALNILGAVLFAVIFWAIIFLCISVVSSAAEANRNSYGPPSKLIPWLIVNGVLSSILMGGYLFFLAKRQRLEQEKSRHGTARLGNANDVIEHITLEGIYIGGAYSLNEMGHIMTVGSTRSGKGTNLIIPALLDIRNYAGSWVIIDPKGENAAITAGYQISKGQHVHFLDPWGLHTDTPDTYNPLDFVRMGDDLADDAMVIAEMIVPADTAGPDRFWSDRARSLIAGLIMHIKQSDMTLNDLFSMLRLEESAFALLAKNLQSNPNPVIAATGNEIVSGLKNEKMFTSIMATALQYTDFLKSPALQYNMEKSSFEMADLTKGKTTLYIIVPADKLHSHYQWLRLISTCSMMTAVRHHDEKVTFLLDEFANLGNLPNVASGLAYMAGYNITLWMVLQSLPQLRNLYRDHWEDFIANTFVKQYVGIADNFTAEYVSQSTGGMTFMTVDEGDKSNPHSQTRYNSSQRLVMTPEEAKGNTENHILLQIGKAPTLVIPKRPYFLMEKLKTRAAANPMHQAATEPQSVTGSAPA